MKFSKGFLAVMTGTLALSGLASAQTVSAEKKGPLQTILSDLTGNIEVRQQTDRTTDKGDYVSDKPVLSFRPALGASLFDGSVDTTFTWIFAKKTDKASIDRSYLYNETYWYALQGKKADVDYKFGTYSYFEQLSDENQFGLQQHGLYLEATSPLETTAGTITFGLISNPVAEFLSNDRIKKDGNKIAVANRTGRDSLALQEEKEDGTLTEVKTDRQDPSYWNDSELSVKLNPAPLPKLSVKAALEYVQHWDPKYVAVDNEGGDRTKQEGYTNTGIVLNKLAVGYKITDKVSLTNSLRYHLGGFYQSRVDQNRPDPTGAFGTATWENRLILSAAIF